MTETGSRYEIAPVAADGPETPSPGVAVVIPEGWSADLVFVTDLQGRLLFMNDSWQRRVGYPAPAALGPHGGTAEDRALPPREAGAPDPEGREDARQGARLRQVG